jgi:23S rRNA (adenine2503-C2)-methyltransferase
MTPSPSDSVGDAGGAVEKQLHVGALTTAQLTAWAQARGASAEAARLLARQLVGRFAGRSLELHPSHRLVSLATAHIRDAVPVVVASPAADGTVRYAVHFQDGALVEAVAILHPERTTVCLSTQAGCARGCLFCETGRLGLSRNLSTEEISGQFAAVARALAAEGKPAPTNIVFMGMGEPLDNLDAVLGACDVLSDTCGFGIAPRRITVSTVGVVPKMREFHRRARVRLAVSLHAANDEERRALLPIARSWDLAELRAAIAEARNSVFLQWTLIAGANDSERHARELLAFCAGLDVRVNLIPLNPGPEETLRAPPMERVRAFQKWLSDAGIRTLVRMPHGQEVGGACGQLAGSLRQRPELKPRLPVVGRRQVC